MIYIHKNHLPPSLFVYTQTQIASHLPILYEGKWDKDEFRKLVANEQSRLCCYCTNIISPDNSTIEHFLPESIFKEEVANYFNLFLACNYSKSKLIPKRQQHCDTSTEAKAEKLIPKYISLPKCELFFAYNESGEILPFCNYKSIETCCKEYKSLTDEQKMILSTIDVLKLNVESLKAQRSSFYSVCLSKIIQMPDDNLLQEVRNYYIQKNKHELQRFCGVYFYLLRVELTNRKKGKEFEEVIEKWRKPLLHSYAVTTFPL